MPLPYYSPQAYGPAQLDNKIALTATCRFIRQENTRIFFASNTFVLHTQQNGARDAAVVLERFCAVIGDQKASALRSVTFDYGLFRTLGPDTSYCTFAWVFKGLRDLSNDQPHKYMRLKADLICDYQPKVAVITMKLDVRDIEGSLKGLHEWATTEMGMLFPAISSRIELVALRRDVEETQSRLGYGDGRYPLI